MNCYTLKLTSKILKTNNNKLIIRGISIKTCNYHKDHYRLVIVGAGAGGLSTAAKSIRKLGAGNVAIIDPATLHCKFRLLTLTYT
jgi:hypothetical protein